MYRIGAHPPSDMTTHHKPTAPGLSGEGAMTPMIEDTTDFPTSAFQNTDSTDADIDCTVCFSGHREIPEREREALAARLEAALIRLVEGGYNRFFAGGAIGFDTMAAEAVLRLRVRYPQIRLHLALPCHGQEKRWSEDNRRTYDRIRDAADFVVYTSPLGYTHGCMQQRDRYLVDQSSVCLCYLTHLTGGTAYTVSYARRRGLSVINLAADPAGEEEQLKLF